MRRQDAKDALDKIPLCSLSFPAEGEGGKTGSWRVKRPIVRAEKCLLMRGKKSCHLCWVYCPEGVVSRTAPPEIDYVYCKGCGLCAHECPGKAIDMVNEHE